jgi:hypothetical protein
VVSKQLFGLAVSTVVIALWSEIVSGRGSHGLPDATSWIIAGAVVLGGGLLGIVLHEAAHAASGLKRGATVTRVRIGMGPLLGTVTVGRVPVEVHLIPSTGRTTYRGVLAVDDQRAFYRAGPRVHLVLVAGSVSGAALTHGVLRQTLAAMAMHQAFVWITNSLPSTSETGLPGNDGWHLRQLRQGLPIDAPPTWNAVLEQSNRGDQEPLREAAALVLARPLELADRVTAEGMRFLALFRAGDFGSVVTGARSLAPDLVEHQKAAGAVGFTGAHALLTGALLSVLHPDAAQIDAALAEVRSAPDNPDRAHAVAVGLILTGRPSEAVPLLRDLDLEALARVDRAAVLGTLALALSVTGRNDQATELAQALPTWSPFHRAVHHAVGLSGEAWPIA